VSVLRTALVVIGLLAATSPTSAQDTGGITEATRTMFQMAYCAVRRDAADARKLFMTAPGSKDEAKLIRSLTSQQCFGFLAGAQNPEFDRQLIRGAIAEAVLDDARSRKGHPDPSVAPFGNLSVDAIASLDAKGQASLIGLDFAQCVVAASPEDVKALLNTNPTWGTQDKAIQQLQPYLGPCLPKGAEVSFSKLVLRGLLAEADYRSLYFTTAAGKK
jgi:hypothetical protein